MHLFYQNLEFFFISEHYWDHILHFTVYLSTGRISAHKLLFNLSEDLQRSAAVQHNIYLGHCCAAGFDQLLKEIDWNCCSAPIWKTSHQTELQRV